MILNFKKKYKLHNKRYIFEIIIYMNLQYLEIFGFLFLIQNKSLTSILSKLIFIRYDRDLFYEKVLKWKTATFGL